MRRARLLAAATAALLALGGGIAYGAAGPQSVACSITGSTLTCPLPSSTTTVTKTVTKAGPTTTVTRTVTSAAPTTPTTPTTAPATPVQQSGFPNASDTGVPPGTVLTASTAITASTAGQVIDSKDVSGGITVAAANVVIKNSRISGGGSGQCINVVGSGSVTIQDSEITGNCENGIGFDNWTAIRVNLHGTFGDGAKLGSNVTLQDSYIHNLVPAAGAHSDGGQMQSGEANILISHNTIDLGSTVNGNSALFIAPDLGPNSNGPVTIQNNFLNGGNYTVYIVDGNNGQYIVKNISLTSNTFGPSHSYGAEDINVPVTETGSVFQ